MIICRDDVSPKIKRINVQNLSVRQGKLRGFVATEKETIEISPLTEEQQSLFLRFPPALDIPLDESIVGADTIVVEDLYVVKKVKLPTFGAVEEQFTDGKDTSRRALSQFFGALQSVARRF